MGFNTTASGGRSTAMGFYTDASGSSSTAMGEFTLASGLASTAMGNSTTASGTESTAMGLNTSATAPASTAMGTNNIASGNYSTAMANYVSTSNFDGAFAIGDNSTTTIMGSFVANGFRCRFAGGYRLLTNSAATIGVVLGASGNAWSAISDVNMKENFIPVNGENVLASIAAMPQYTWTIKPRSKNIQTLRPYGAGFL